MVTSVTKGGRDTEIAQRKLRLPKYTDMAIHLNAVEEHFLLVPVTWAFLFRRKNAFYEFPPQNLSP
jgi:hypothetical protein